MSFFLIADVKVTDDAWIPDYAANTHKIVEKHGGRYLTRSGNITVLEGDQTDSTLIAILEFPTRQALEAFVQDPAYAQFANARMAGSVSNFRMIDDTDIAGSIPYLTAG